MYPGLAHGSGGGGVVSVEVSLSHITPAYAELTQSQPSWRAESITVRGERCYSRQAGWLEPEAKSLPLDP